jgi:hypothetical protein
MPLGDSRDVLEGYSPDVLAQTCLTVQAPVMHTETCSVILALLADNCKSDLVRSWQGEARQSRPHLVRLAPAGLMNLLEKNERDAVPCKIQ